MPALECFQLYASLIIPLVCKPAPFLVPDGFANIISSSLLVAILLQSGLAPKTRARYLSATNSWESFYTLQLVQPYPVQKPYLCEQIARRAFRTPTMRQVFPLTLSNYVSILQSKYIDFRYFIIVFNNLFIKRLLTRARSLFLQKKKEKLPIIRDILT